MKMQQLCWHSRYYLWKEEKFEFFWLHLSCKYLFFHLEVMVGPKELSFHQSQIECKNVYVPALIPVVIFYFIHGPQPWADGGKKELKSPGSEFWLIPWSGFFCMIRL